MARKLKPTKLEYNGIEYSIVEATYESSFSDGTKILISYKTKVLDPISGDLVNGHLNLITLIF